MAHGRNCAQRGPVRRSRPRQLPRGGLVGRVADPPRTVQAAVLLYRQPHECRRRRARRSEQTQGVIEMTRINSLVPSRVGADVVASVAVTAFTALGIGGGITADSHAAMPPSIKVAYAGLDVS